MLEQLYAFQISMKWNENILLEEKAEITIGHRVVPYSKVIDWIMFVLRTGYTWKMVPKEYGSGFHIS